jgi:F-type H+-transporting ATPase subunit a
MAAGHEVTLYAEPIGKIGNFVVTNSLLTSWLAAAVLLILALVLRFGLKTIPGRFQSGVEVIFEGALGLADSVTGSRKKSLIFLPIVLPLFLFILLNNWLGILPGIGSIGIGEAGEIVPLFRGSTADLNTTLALSLVAVIITHLAGVFLAGARSHLNRFVGFDLLLAIPGEIGRGHYQAILVNPIRFLVGIIEIVGELAKVASLSFRLFGNVFAGEVLLGAMATIFAYILPVPFLFLEIFVGLIQAVIFAMLVLVFLSVMSESHEEAH